MRVLLRRRAGLLLHHLLIAAFAGLVPAAPARAGAPIILKDSGIAYVWPDGGRNIPFSPDAGNLGPLTNAEAVAATETAFGAWQAVPTATASFTDTGRLPVDIDASNFAAVLFPQAPDGINQIVYDDTGEIFDRLYGPYSGVLAFAGPQWIDTDQGTIVEGVAFIDGPPLADYASWNKTPAEVAVDVQVHEFGHFLNLDHSVVNGQILFFLDNSGPSPIDAFPLDDLIRNPRVETMYFVYCPICGVATPDKDDAAILSMLYPEPGFRSTTGTISGTVYLDDGTTRLNGVNVIARNIADPYGDAVSSYTGQFSATLDQSDPYTGRYELAGLTPGATYLVYVDEILGGSYAVPPLVPLPNVEEFYNAPRESWDPRIDDPQDATGVTVTAGTVTSGVDIIFNRFLPGVPLPLGDDQGINLPLPFTFSFCGVDYNRLFVHPNGFLTIPLQGGFADPLEDVRQFLAYEPRIAALWHDLNPTAGGTVTFEQTTDTFSVIWDKVPEYPDLGSNSFKIVLHRASNRADVVYGGMTLQSGLAGYTCGGLVTNGLEPVSDLTLLASKSSDGTIGGRNKAAIYELFTPQNPLDSAGATLSYALPNAFQDPFEPNNTPAQAAPIKLPFNSQNLFTSISGASPDFPPPPDVDFFRFKAAAGTTIQADTVPIHGSYGGTIVGLFDAVTGQMLAFDDFSGPNYWSHLVYTVPADGVYAVGVTGFPDYGFAGSPLFWWGRYILDVRVVAGSSLLSPALVPGSNPGRLERLIESRRRGRLFSGG